MNSPPHSYVPSPIASPSPIQHRPSYPSTPSRPSTDNRAEAIGRYRSGNLSSLPPLTSPTASRSGGTEQQLPSRKSSISSNNNTTHRRPRAGTMPSTLNNPIQPTPLSLLNAPPSARPEILRQLNMLGGGTGTSTGLLGEIGNSHLTHHPIGPQPDTGLHASNSDINLRLSLDKTRARAGTVALPPSSASSYFGRGVFSANFVPRSSRMNEEVRSMRSDDSIFGDNELSTEPGHVRTLDYLGLDTDSPVSPPHQPQSAFASNGFYNLLSQPHLGPGQLNALASLAGRMRASTVSGITPTGLRRPELFDDHQINQDEDFNVPLASANSMISQYALATGRPGQTRIVHTADPLLHHEAHEQSAPSPVYSSMLSANTGPSLLRPRASTMAGASLMAGAGQPGLQALNGLSAAAVRNRAGTMAGLSKHPAFLSSISSESSDNGPFGPVDNNHWMSGSRPMTPEGGVSAGLVVQQPSRTLWIGNLDPSTTAQELMSVFAVYGAIESLRLLPDKECGFVNFVSIHDAVHAKDDIANRLGSQITLKHGPTLVRIGFGKPESAPVTPGSAGPVLGQAGYTNFGGVLLGPNGDPVLQSSPTRALWVGSIPAQTTPNHLMEIFSPYGAIESARVLTHKNCGFRARKALSGREILGSEVGAVKIGYAKVPVKAPGTFSPTSGGVEPDAAHQQLAYESLARMRGASVVPVEQQIMSGSIQDYRSNLAMSFIPNGIHAFAGFGTGLSVPGSVGMGAQSSANLSQQESGNGSEGEGGNANICSVPMPPVTEMQLLMRQLSATESSEAEAEEDEAAVAEFRPPVTYYTTVPPPINQLDPHRRLLSATADPARLREIRKRIDNANLGPEEMDKVAGELMDEIVYLSSDYIGNTIVQKLFEKCSQPVKMQMLERCAPHLAIIGCHKNGTWAAQKIIDCATTPEEIAMICTNLRPFGPPLLLDPLGNYVMQCCLRFGAPMNEFVFEAMVDRCWEVAQGRFGARSMRTCLESKHCTRAQMKRVAIGVILNSIPLATNPNGSLLLTWLLDSSNLPGRYSLLAPRLAPHLAHLCTHKLASVTVLRVINQSVDPEASRAVVDGLFHSSRQVLDEVLGDQVHGVTVLTKILGSQFVNAETKTMMTEKLKEVMITLRVQHIPAYKKLAEELGVPTTAPPGGAPMSTSASVRTQPPTPPRSWQPTPSAQLWTNGPSTAQQQAAFAAFDPRAYSSNNSFMPIQPQVDQLGLVNDQQSATATLPYLMMNQLRFQPSM
ncbi:hypothetical protein CROQUDRAFT_43052 [Cronartium quercuum f. sp. fusiforme G11]|uniref:Uncharacterized protein n=1 Tax=Cronartium quercuum f. sp. fusiforme G11 TaxID=708437 RepID=A0A9P6TD52_9BASI|nr:hypothetical protein CROQUDRAFT_43052 [Cronartium quercuum f. sp. fusiforme G11]